VRARLPLILGLAAAVALLPHASAQADPQPTIAQAKAKLEKLNRQADALVDRYNAANEKWKKAKRQYAEVNRDYNKRLIRVEQLKRQLVAMAVNTYQVGGFEPLSLAYTPTPDAMLSGLATLDQIARERAIRLEEYQSAMAGLKQRRNEKKRLYEEAAKRRAELAEEKKKVERLIAEQTRLLRKLQAYNPGDPNSPGKVYTGPASGNARIALQFAYRQIGKPYRYGGTGPNAWDCSGLVQAAWAAAGVRLPRTSYEQWAWGANRRVPLDQLQPGDLVWKNGYSHVGLYAGNGKVVHAPRTGDVVKEVSLAEYRPTGAVRP
jgi:peptidoglycan DL-endopeptidase CwlO